MKALRKNKNMHTHWRWIEWSQQRKSEKRKGRQYRKAMVRIRRLEIWCAFARPSTIGHISLYLSLCVLNWRCPIAFPLYGFLTLTGRRSSSSRCNRFDNNMQCTFANTHTLTKPFQWISNRFGILMCVSLWNCQTTKNVRNEWKLKL